MPFIEPIQPRKAQYTKWTNPLDVPQRVHIAIDDPRRPLEFTWAPGETIDVPVEYDQIIQRTHEGVVIGGLAPQLRRAGQTEPLDVALDTRAQERRAADAELAAAALAKAAQEQAMILATQKVAEAKAKEPEAPAPAPAPSKSKG